jgi:type IV secretory pathway TrbD component
MDSKNDQIERAYGRKSGGIVINVGPRWFEPLLLLGFICFAVTLWLGRFWLSAVVFLAIIFMIVMVAWRQKRDPTAQAVIREAFKHKP